MISTRVKPTAQLILILLPLIIIGCQQRAEAPGLRVAETGDESHQAAPIPGIGGLPPLPPPPNLKEGQVQTAIEAGNNTQVIDEYLHVWYIPCEPLPFTPVAPIILTDLHSGSVVYLNRDGALRKSPKPDYRTDEGSSRLQVALKDSSLMKQVLTFPECS